MDTKHTIHICNQCDEINKSLIWGTVAFIPQLELVCEDLEMAREESSCSPGGELQICKGGGGGEGRGAVLLQFVDCEVYILKKGESLHLRAE